jgi:hypothetical protein
MNFARPWKYYGCLFSCLTCLTSCAVVRTVDHQGATQTQYAFGPILNIGAESDKAIGNVRSFGLSRTPLGVSLGYSSQQFVIDNEDCRLVVWIENEVEAQALMESLNKMDNVCVNNNSGRKNNE